MPHRAVVAPILLLLNFAPLVIGSPPDPARVAFDAPRSLDLQARVRSIAIGDFDSDGRDDAAIATVSDRDHIVILRGERVGITKVQEIVSGADPVGVEAADLDEDGAVDLIVANGRSGSIALHRGSGDGRFGSPVVLVDISGPRHVECEDIDGDGHLDVAVAAGSEHVYVYRGDGSGGISASYQAPIPFVPDWIEVGDLDGDGDNDILACHSRGRTLAPLRNDGSGRLVAAPAIELDVRISEVALADLDRDATPDIVAVSYRDHGVHFLRGEGEGRFRAHPRRIHVGYPSGLEVVDYDGDSQLDVAVVAHHANRILILRSGTRSPFNNLVELSTVTKPHSQRAGDFDGDGRLDFLVGASSFFDDEFGGVALHRGLGRGELRVARGFGPAQGYRDLVAADFDGDGAVDVASAHLEGEVRLHLSDGRGGFALGAVMGGSRSMCGIAAADFDGDGRLDVVTESDAKIEVFLGDGRGGLLSPLVSTAGQQLVSIHPADFDGDGSTDLICAGDIGVRVLLGDGAGRFPRDEIVIEIDAVREARVADINRDGSLDLLVRRAGFAPGADPGDLLVFMNEGPGRLVERARVQVEGGGVGRMVLADLNEDGHIDVIHLRDRQLFTLFGDGAGHFLEQGAGQTASDEAYRLAAADFDGDSHVDVAILHDTAVAVYLGDGAGGLDTSERFEVGGYTWDLLARDADLDGLVDLIASAGDHVAVLRNSRLDSLGCRKGNVQSASGDAANVVRVNGSAGEGPARRLMLPRDSSVSIEVVPVPSSTRSPFALYAWAGAPDAGTVEIVTPDVGRTCMSTPFRGGPAPIATWNNLGAFRHLGWPTSDSRPAPSLIVASPHGVGRDVSFFVQGFIRDPRANSDLGVAITNGVQVDVR